MLRMSGGDVHGPCRAAAVCAGAALCVILTGCTAQPSAPQAPGAQQAVAAVQGYLRSKERDTAWPALQCEALQGPEVRALGGHYLVLCDFDVQQRQWGNHTGYLLGSQLELLEVIPGK